MIQNYFLIKNYLCKFDGQTKNDRIIYKIAQVVQGMLL